MFPHPRSTHVQIHVSSAVAKAAAAAAVLVLFAMAAGLRGGDPAAEGAGSEGSAAVPECSPANAGARPVPPQSAGCAAAPAGSQPAADVAERIVDWGGQSEEGWSGIAPQPRKAREPAVTRPADDRRRVFEERRRRYEGGPGSQPPAR